jgi:hypothetical protein
MIHLATAEALNNRTRLEAFSGTVSELSSVIVSSFGCPMSASPAPCSVWN